MDLKRFRNSLNLPHCALTSRRTTSISSALIWSTTAEKLPVFRVAHSRKNDRRCAWIIYQVGGGNKSHKTRTNLHVHRRNRILLKIFIVIFLQNVVVVKGHPLRTNELGEELKFIVRVQFLLLGPIFVLKSRNSQSESVNGRHPRLTPSSESTS